MRDAARALDDVSDHLGEVLRRADELLADWSRFGAQVRDQVERDAAAVGEVVEGAIARVGAAGIDRAIGDRLRALTAELERLEQRARAASRAASEQRAADRRLLWGAIAGIVLANALLVVLILRRPEAPSVAEPIRLDTAPASATTAAQPATEPPGAQPVADAVSGAAPAAGSAAAAAGNPGAPPPGPATAPAAGATSVAGQAAAGGKPAATGSAAPAGGSARATEAGGARASPIVLPPPKPGAAHPHKKLP